MSTFSFDLRHVSFEGRPVPVRREAVRSRAAATPLDRLRRPVGAEDDLPAAGFPAFVLASAGLDAGAYRARPLQRRTAACLRALRCPDEAAARALLVRRPEWLALALDVLLIGVTAPFRDEQVFETIQRQVVPALAERVRLRVWSAGCASGAELMSVAALLAEAGLLERSVLLGTDCRAEAVAQATSGACPLTEFPVRFRDLQQAFFEPVAGDAWRPRERLLSSASWTQADLTLSLERGPWDLVLCRNLAMYLTRAAADELTRRLVEVLAPGGFLVVGKAERPTLPGLVPVQHCVYRKEGDVAR